MKGIEDPGTTCWSSKAEKKAKVVMQFANGIEEVYKVALYPRAWSVADFDNELNGAIVELLDSETGEVTHCNNVKKYAYQK